MDNPILPSNILTKYTPIMGNVDPDLYKSCIVDAQRTRLEEILGEDLYAKIYNDYFDDTLTGDYLELYDSYVVPFLVHQSAVEYLLIGAYKVANNGIFKAVVENGQSVDKGEVDYLVQNQRNKADMYKERMQRWLCKNPLPEYNSTTDDIVPPLKNGFVYRKWYIE